MTRGGRGRGQWLWAVAVLALFVGLRAYHLGAPLLDHSDWRQADTASIARFYYLEGVRLLHPQVLYDGPGPNYVQVELPLGEALAAEAAHLFGWSAALLHATAVALSTGSLVALYFLLRLEVGRRAAVWGSLLYAISPLAVYYGRAFQAEPAMMCFGLLALWAFSAWSRRPTVRRLVVASALLALAIAAKLPNAILGLPILALALRRRSLRRPLSLLLALGLPYVAAGLYTVVSGRTASGQGAFVSRVAVALFTQPGWQEGSPAVAHFWIHNLLVGAAGVGMAILLPLGTLALPRSARGFVVAWALALLFWCLFIVTRIRQDYYLLPCCPFLAAVGGVALDTAWRKRRRLLAVVGVAALSLVVVADLLYLPPLYRVDRATGQLALAMDQACPRGPVVVGTGNSAILYAAWREGWRTAAIDRAELQQWARAGATVVVPLAATISPGAQSWLAAHTRLESPGGVPLYVVSDCAVS